MGVNASNELSVKIITGEEYTREFRETFSDVNFVGMRTTDAIQILKDRGYEKYKFCTNDNHITKIMKKEVIIFTNRTHTFVVKQPEFC